MRRGETDDSSPEPYSGGEKMSSLMNCFQNLYSMRPFLATHDFGLLSFPKNVIIENLIL